MWSAYAFNLDKSKMLLCGKEVLLDTSIVRAGFRSFLKLTLNLEKVEVVRSEGKKRMKKPDNHYKQFFSNASLIFMKVSKCQMLCSSKGSLCRCILTLSQTSPGFYVSALKVFGKHCWKRRNCSKRAISPLPTVFSTYSENFLPFSSSSKLSSANSFSLEESKFCRLGKG